MNEIARQERVGMAGLAIAIKWIKWVELKT